MFYCGIDPGKNGGLVLLDENQQIVEQVKFNKEEYIRILGSYKDMLILLEKVHSMPKQGVRSMFTFGENFGFIQGVIEANKHIYELIEPSKWKKYFGLIGFNKKDSCLKALELEPTLKCIGKRGGYLDGICEAYLIALYRKLTKENQ